MRIVLSGATGAMGRVITELVKDSNDEIVLGYAIDDAPLGYRIVQNLDGEKIDADVMIDFSHPSALPSVVDFALRNKLPIVMATTGLSEENIGLLKSAAKEVAIVQSGNYSVGIVLMKKLVNELSRELGDSVDVEIVETHHNRKVDAPSGTALMLGKEIEDGRGASLTKTFGRDLNAGRREKLEIGYHSVRGGTVVGEHSVFFYGLDESIEIKHTAMSKKLFAVGALRAARMLVERPAGFYSIDDLYRS